MCRGVSVCMYAYKCGGVIIIKSVRATLVCCEAAWTVSCLLNGLAVTLNEINTAWRSCLIGMAILIMD